ncbi:type VII toxin-antitoxin system MntA family adenylyltransferase antitoxin [Methanolobus bombayensis]|uniref:type VII toxin-antitoxin system MntA family adenylyltransferase antitoxin n=1 Tax=Methanolobus bombayensis TaxID=38023 RepID=UPI001AE89F54|nr:nucleotidyltransferase domain-containing protein [Methanolobus bombayensis]MBP1909623.1 putative nucleotidyltransferase [Methanolobus bombayensis]
MPEAHVSSSVFKTSIQKVKAAVLQAFENEDVQIFLFGSRAKGNAHRTSDIDIGILPTGCFDRKIITALRAELEEMNIPYNVDLVDLSTVSEDFRQQVLNEGEIWKGKGSTNSK